MMSENEFQQQVRELFQKVEEGVEALDRDIECDWMSDTVLELTLESGGKIVLTRQTATKEVWVAAPTGGFHYRWQEGAWRNTRDGGTFGEQLAAIVGADLGV